MDPMFRLKQVTAILYIFAIVIIAGACLVRLALAVFPEFF